MFLELHDLWKRYRNQKAPAIRGVTLKIDSKRITALAGESGSGKTTLLRLIAGFERPDRGTILRNGEPFVAPGVFLPPQKRSVAMIFQDLALFPHLTVRQNVAFAITDAPRRERLRRAEALVDSVGLAGYARKYPHELSGGQRQRVALARALASDADTILMDEPFSNLDPELKWRMIAEVRDLLEAAGRTVVFVTHDKEEAFALADDIAVIKEGRLLQFGEAREVYRSPVSHAVARFFGRVNRIPAGACRSDRREVSEVLLVRPEHCRIEPQNGAPAGCGGSQTAGDGAPRDETNRLPGVVRTSRFMGEYWETEVQPTCAAALHKESIIVREHRPRDRGEAVWVVLPSDSAAETTRSAADRHTDACTATPGARTQGSKG